MENPTVVVLTDRNDLDDQLFGTFSRCQDLLRQPPTQADSRADLRNKLSVGNQQKWDSVRPERSGAGLRSSQLPERPVVLSSPLDCLGLHLLPSS